MLAMFRKQLRQASPAAVALSLIVMACIASSREFEITSSPRRDGAVALVAVLWGVFGLWLGFANFALEESRTTRLYWLHRGVAARRVFIAKTIAELLALALALCAVIAFDAAWTNTVIADRIVATPLYGRYLELVIASASAVLGHSIGSLCAHLRRPMVARIGSAWFAGCGAVFLTSVWQRNLGDPVLGNELAWLVAMFGGAAVLYLTAERAFRAGPDEHRVPPQSARLSLNLFALSIGGAVGLLCVALLQKLAVVGALSSAPWVRQQDGVVVEASGRESRGSPDTRVLFDPVARPDAWPATREADDFRFGRGSGPFDFGDGWKSIGNLSFEAGADAASPRYAAWIGARSGRVLVEELPLRESAASSPSAPQALVERRRRFLVQRADHKRFSRRLLVLPSLGARDVQLLYDGDDSTLWSWSAEGGEPVLVRVELPSGDTPQGTDAAIDPRLLALDSPYTRWGDSTTVIRGQRARYRWTGSGFEAVERLEGRAWRSDPEPPRVVAIDVVDTDALEPAVVLREVATGRTLYEHDYAAPTLLNAAARTTSVFRSPLGGVASFLDSSVRRPVDLELIKDPLLADGRRAWLLALNIALSLTLAAWFATRRQLGLRWTWFVVLALLGPSVAAIAFTIEPKQSRFPRLGCSRRPRISQTSSPRLTPQPIA